MCGGWGRKAALCGMPRFLRPLGRSQRLRRAGGWGVRCMPRFAACRVSCGLRAARNACGVGCGGGAWGACRVLWPVAFLAAFGPLATLAPIVLRHRDLGHRREACALWALGPKAQSDPKVGSETSGGRGQRPPRQLSDRESAPNPGKARREACAQWALGPKAQSDPKRGSETMSATVREARMIEQPGRPLHPALFPLLPYRTTLFRSRRNSSVTPSGGSPNVALSVRFPLSHVSCMAISRASIRQPSPSAVTRSPTS